MIILQDNNDCPPLPQPWVIGQFYHTRYKFLAVEQSSNLIRRQLLISKASCPCCSTRQIWHCGRKPAGRKFLCPLICFRFSSSEASRMSLNRRVQTAYIPFCMHSTFQKFSENYAWYSVVLLIHSFQNCSVVLGLVSASRIHPFNTCQAFRQCFHYFLSIIL